MHIGLREIEKTRSQMAKYIEDLESGDHFIEKNLEVNISSALQSILQDVKSFGDININTNSSTLQIKAGRKVQAQQLVPKNPGIEQIKAGRKDHVQHLVPKYPRIEKMKPSLLTRLKIPKDKKSLSIFACLILPDGKFILLDYNKRQVLLFSNDGIFIRKVVTFKDYTCDACFVRNNTVAVALGLENKTAMVDIEKNKIIHTINFSHNCYGVASDGKTLIISCGGGQCTTVNLNDMSHTIVEGMGGAYHISLSQGNIYGTLYSESRVCCYNSTGEPLWTFQHRDIASPVRLTLDRNCFVYIVSCENSSIVVVSPDGKTCKIVLSQADGIKSAININRERGMMIVSSKISDDSRYYDSAFV